MAGGGSSRRRREEGGRRSASKIGSCSKLSEFTIAAVFRHDSALCFGGMTGNPNQPNPTLPIRMKCRPFIILGIE